MWKQFKPALLFVVRFVGLYLAGNIGYGVYISAFNNRPDTITHWVTQQAAALVSVLFEPVSIAAHAVDATVLMQQEGETIISVYEGCNGVNVLIIFVAFVLAFGGRVKLMLPFILLGLVAIHVANLVRIVLLYAVMTRYDALFYFFHKYLFTASLYAVVFGLWVVWVKYFQGEKPAEQSA